jgi:carbon monoxide dehydrogenase subunit G
MTTVMKSSTIPASVDAVWAVLADFATISQWAPNVDHSCLLSDQADGVGMVRRIQTGRTTVVETVEHWEPGVALRYAITGLPPIIRSVTNTWSLESQVAGTVASLTTEIDAGPRLPQQGIAKVVGRKLGQASDEMLAGLANHFATSPEQQEQQEQHA